MLSAQVLSKEFESFTFTFDSGANVHLLSLEAAMALFANSRVATLRITGISGTSTKADLVGHLIIRVQDPVSGQVYFVDLGKAYGMKSVPLNLLSVSMLSRRERLFTLSMITAISSLRRELLVFLFSRTMAYFNFKGGVLAINRLYLKLKSQSSLQRTLF